MILSSNKLKKSFTAAVLGFITANGVTALSLQVVLYY